MPASVKQNNNSMALNIADNTEIYAETLELPLDLFSSNVGDTDTTGYSDVSAGSRTTMATGIAAIKAAKDVLSQMKDRVAQIWEIDVDAIQYKDGVFTNTEEPGERLTYA